MTGSGQLEIAVVGSGISGLSAAWLLSKAHRVTLYEAANRLGGHTNTVLAPQPDGSAVPVDTGFIVFNEKTYPNLTALFAHLGVETRATDMSFAVSMRGGALEYGSTSLKALFAQKRNLVNPRFLAMLADLVRFYRTAPSDLAGRCDGLSLGDYLTTRGYGRAFQEDHLLPQAAAIWSASASDIRSFPAEAFIRFFDNHGLLELDVNARPQWRTVLGGSRSYIHRLTGQVELKAESPVTGIRRDAAGVTVHDRSGEARRFDRVVVAAHANQALAVLDQPTQQERELLGAFRYSRNTAILHTDTRLMPRRRAAWSAWNYVSTADGAGEVTYWMNLLQGLKSAQPLLVSLNPARAPAGETIIREEYYEHPLFDQPALDAQRRLWALQGVGGVYYCGAHFGAGFHEDGLQAGLAVAEAIGGVRRPWNADNESGRIHLHPSTWAQAA